MHRPAQTAQNLLTIRKHAHVCSKCAPLAVSRCTQTCAGRRACVCVLRACLCGCLHNGATRVESTLTEAADHPRARVCVWCVVFVGACVCGCVVDTDRIPYPSARPFPCPSLSLPPRFPLHAWAKVSWNDTPTGAKHRRRLRKCHRAPGTGTHVGGGTPYYFKPRAMRPGRVPTRREQPGIDGGTQYHSQRERERE